MEFRKAPDLVGRQPLAQCQPGQKAGAGAVPLPQPDYLAEAVARATLETVIDRAWQSIMGALKSFSQRAPAGASAQRRAAVRRQPVLHLGDGGPRGRRIGEDAGESRRARAIGRQPRGRAEARRGSR